MKTEIKKRPVLVNIDNIDRITKLNDQESRIYFSSGQDILISNTDVFAMGDITTFVKVEELLYPSVGTGPG